MLLLHYSCICFQMTITKSATIINKLSGNVKKLGIGALGSDILS